MARRTLAGLILCVVSAVTGVEADELASPVGHQPGEVPAILETLDRYMHAISADDLPAMKAMQTPEGMTYRSRAAEDGHWEVVARSNAWWVDPANRQPHVYRERYWNPTVLVRGHLALVWAPYEFWIDGKTSHCGIDQFDFVKIDGRWLVSNSMWTVEPDACDELRPAEKSAIRPAD